LDTLFLLQKFFLSNKKITDENALLAFCRKTCGIILETLLSIFKILFFLLLENLLEVTQTPLQQFTIQKIFSWA
jgi:hypothetical protein